MSVAGAPATVVSADVAVVPKVALARLAAEAEEWGGRYAPRGDAAGRLELPVVAGIRHGWVAGTVVAEETRDGSRLVYRVEESEYRVQRRQVALLAAAAAGAGVVIAAPVFPALVPAIPLGAMMALAAWLFIVAGLRNSGPEELFASLATGPEPRNPER